MYAQAQATTIYSWSKAQSPVVHSFSLVSICLSTDFEQILSRSLCKTMGVIPQQGLLNVPWLGYIKDITLLIVAI